MEKKWEHCPDIPQERVVYQKKICLGSIDEHEYLIDKENKGWELVGPPINRNAGTVENDVWVYYWKRQVDKEPEVTYGVMGFNGQKF